MTNFKTEEQRLEHNKKCAEYAKKSYHTADGKAKSLIKYYKKKYADDEYIMSLVKDTDMTPVEKVKKMKMYNYQKRMETC